MIGEYGGHSYLVRAARGGAHRLEVGADANTYYAAGGDTIFGLGDIDHDGFCDVLITQHSNSSGALYAGQAVLLHGGPF